MYFRTCKLGPRNGISQEYNRLELDYVCLALFGSSLFSRLVTLVFEVCPVVQLLESTQA